MFFSFIPPAGDHFYTTSISFHCAKLENHYQPLRLPVSRIRIESQQNCATIAKLPGDTLPSMSSVTKIVERPCAAKLERPASTNGTESQQIRATRLDVEALWLEKSRDTARAMFQIPTPLPRSFQGWREDGTWILSDDARHAIQSDPINSNDTPKSLPYTQWTNSMQGKHFHTKPVPTRWTAEEVTPVIFAINEPAEHRYIGQICGPNLSKNLGGKRGVGRSNRHQLSRQKATSMRVAATVLAASKTSVADRTSMNLLTPRPIHALPEAVEKSLSKKMKKLSIQEDWFPLFLELPVELRLKIYAFALPRERLVEMVTEKRKTQYGTYLTARSVTQIPALLQVSYEARNEALKLYPLHFGSGQSYMGIKPRTHFDLQTDIFFLNCHRMPKLGYVDLLHLFNADTGHVGSIQNVQRMAICTGIAKRLARLFRYLLRPKGLVCREKLFRAGMPSLKKVICVSHGKLSLANSKILPSDPEVFPTTLEGKEIEVLELLFGLKVEFATAGAEDAEEVVCACAEVEESV